MLPRFEVDEQDGDYLPVFALPGPEHPTHVQLRGAQTDREGAARLCKGTLSIGAGGAVRASWVRSLIVRVSRTKLDGVRVAVNRSAAMARART